MVDVYNHVKHCTTHPKFLHSNSTSHRWVFGAIAELIDNAIDPDVSASQFCIDMKEFNGVPCLVFMDNGCGLIPEKLHKMLSFGHSKKQTTPGDRSIGKHGNGFKSGTMRLGKDVLVLTKCAHSMTAGFLSQTFLAETGAEDILIPQVSWDLSGNRLSPMDLDIEESLRAICKFSIFPDEESLLAQLEAIPVTGAILIISNLRRHEGVLELDFETDPHDIRITSEINSSHFQQLRPNQPNSTEVPMDFSLRAYVSILYKVPRMQIFIRDKKVKTKRIAGLLSQKEIETYRPYGVSESIRIELGFNTEEKALYGMMLYHRNRLIKAYMRVGMQLEENERGIGVIGLAEADFLQPTHNKQDFDDTTAYRRLLKKLSDVLAEYWWEKKERVHGPQLQLEPRSLRRGINVSSAEDVPDVIWVQCDNPMCLKWRILPPGTDVTVLPDIWYCEYHPEEKFRNHEEPEQEWDTTVQHEIVERRKERKREYDREKKEREAERKRQRLEAATRDSQIAVQQQREALAKAVQEKDAREEQAQREQRQREEDMKKLHEEQKRREEDMKKLNEEYTAMEAKRDEMLLQQKEIALQLEQKQAELAMKAKEKEDNGLSAQNAQVGTRSLEARHAPPVSDNGDSVERPGASLPHTGTTLLKNVRVSKGQHEIVRTGFSGDGNARVSKTQGMQKAGILGDGNVRISRGQQERQKITYSGDKDERVSKGQQQKQKIGRHGDGSLKVLKGQHGKQKSGIPEDGNGRVLKAQRGPHKSGNSPDARVSKRQREMVLKGTTRDEMLQSGVGPPLCDTPDDQSNLISNGGLVSEEENGTNELHDGGHSDTDAEPLTSPIQQLGVVQALNRTQHAKSTVVSPSKELPGKRTMSASQQSIRKGTGFSSHTNGPQAGLTEHRKQGSRALQQAGVEQNLPHEGQRTSQRLEARHRMLAGETMSDPLDTGPTTPASLSCTRNLCLTPILCEPGDLVLDTNSGCRPILSKQPLQIPTSSLEQRSLGMVDPADQDLLSDLPIDNETTLQSVNRNLVSGEGIREHDAAVTQNGEDINSGNAGSLSGLRLVLPQADANLPDGSGMLAVHLPMDSMVSTHNSRSESELTLDRAVFSLQRRLRLALNTLVKLGGSADVNLFELDVLPSQDNEVVSICEKANEHVESRMQNYRQEVASLKAELAYLMADKNKLQHGEEDWNFKIQNLSNKCGIGLDPSKRS